MRPDPKYICPRWWGIDPGEPVEDHIFTDAMCALTDRIDGIGWLMMNIDSSDTNEAATVAGVLVDLAHEAKVLRELWLHHKRAIAPGE